MKHNPGIGATDYLSLRVSVATLVRVIFENPANGESMLALERKAALHKSESGSVVDVNSHPFGGAIRILDLDALHELIGDFHFDSANSRAEQDFRLFIRPSSWSVLREFCIQRLSLVDDPILETDPTRELAEEFFDALQISLKPGQYVCKPTATFVENEPAPTENIRARGIPTVRVYRIFEAAITDADLAQTMLKNSLGLSHQKLCELAMEDARKGGRGRINAVLSLPLKRLHEAYHAMPFAERNVPIMFEQNRLDDTVSSILEGIAVPKYQKV